MSSKMIFCGIFAKNVYKEWFVKKVFSLLVLCLIVAGKVFAVEPLDCQKETPKKTSGNVVFSLQNADKIKFVYLLEGDLKKLLNADFAIKPKKYNKENGILTISSASEKIVSKKTFDKPAIQATVEIEENGIYTICAESPKGDLFVRVVDVGDIDRTPPSEIENFEYCLLNDGSAIFSWGNPKDSDYTEAVLRIDSKEFRVKKDATLVVVNDVSADSKIEIYAADDVGNLSKAAESSNRLVVVETVECGHKADYENYSEPESVGVDVFGYNLDKLTVEDFDLSSETLKFKNVELKPIDANNSKLQFDIPDEAGKYDFLVKVNPVANSDAKNKKMTITSAGTKPMICDCSISNDTISSVDDKNGVVAIKGFNLDKLDQKSLMVCWLEGKDDIVTGKKELLDKNSLKLNFSFGGISNYPAWNKANAPWQKQSDKAFRVLALKENGNTVKEFDVYSKIEAPLAPLVADGKRLPDWIGQCNFYGKSLIKLLNSPELGVTHTLKLVGNELFVNAKRVVEGVPIGRMELRIGLDKSEQSSEIHYVSVKNLQTGEEDSRAARDIYSYAEALGFLSQTLPVFYDCSGTNFRPF